MIHFCNLSIRYSNASTSQHWINYAFFFHQSNKIFYKKFVSKTCWNDKGPPLLVHNYTPSVCDKSTLFLCELQHQFAFREKMAPKQQHMLLFYSAMTHKHKVFTQQTVSPFEAAFFHFFVQLSLWHLLNFCSFQKPPHTATNICFVYHSRQPTCFIMVQLFFRSLSYHYVKCCLPQLHIINNRTVGGSKESKLATSEQ